MSRKLPSPELLRQLLRYEPETGRLFWLPRPVEMFSYEGAAQSWNTRRSGQEAFTTINAKGYRTGRLLGKGYLAHRVIWAMHTGSWPTDMIDHIDRCPSNNVISNLRAASASQNIRNAKSREGSSSRFLGVAWFERSKKWRTQIQSDGLNRHVGYYDSEVEAAKAYDDAAIRSHGAFANLNFP